MNTTRRQLLKLGLGAVPLSYFIANRTSLFTTTANAATPVAAKPNSKFNGVQIGIIAPYSFRGLPSTAEDILRNMVELGINAVELQNDPVERFAGAPTGGRGGGPGGSGAIPGLTSDQQSAVAAINDALALKAQAASTARAALAQASYSDAAAIPSRLAALNAAELELANTRAEAFTKLQGTALRLNDQQVAALVAQASPPAPGGGRGGRGGGGPGGGGNPEMTAWRASVSMDKFKALRKMYNDVGVSIYAFKLGLNLNSPDSEYEYAFNVCEALGAKELTMELPNDPATTKRIGEYAAKRKLWVGYHAHTQAHLNFWDTAFSQSEYNGANIDIGHYVAGTSQSPIPFIEKHHARITSMHLKDRKINNGPNMPWGQGDTPIKEVLQLMKRDKHTYPGTIELEYNVPQGSTVLAELAKCVQYAKDALM
jgi:sugar phosphate isomerase/epimerase